MRALVISVRAVVAALTLLVVALATAPLRMVCATPAKHGRPASTGNIEVQVHLSDAGRVRAIEGSCRAALQRAARTWAPFALPLDRVEVIASAPPLGKADIFEEWLKASHGFDTGNGSLVVVSIGTSHEGRDLTSDEIAGALVGQIERLVIDRYQREHPLTTQQQRITIEPVGLSVVVPPVAATVDPAGDSVARTDNVTDISALIAGISKGRPLVPAGPSKNGVHLEPDPAS
jgi:hypothetical protein